MALVTVAYVLFAIWDEDFGGQIPSAVLLVLALALLAEFIARFLDSQNRWRYLRRHWIDAVACIPVIGGLRIRRIFRLLRLLAGLRLMVAIERQLELRQLGRGSLWFLGPTLVIVWTGSAYAIWGARTRRQPGGEVFCRCTLLVGDHHHNHRLRRHCPGDSARSNRRRFTRLPRYRPLRFHISPTYRPISWAERSHRDGNRPTASRDRRASA